MSSRRVILAVNSAGAPPVAIQSPPINEALCDLSGEGVTQRMSVRGAAVEVMHNHRGAGKAGVEGQAIQVPADFASDVERQSRERQLVQLREEEGHLRSDG